VDGLDSIVWSILNEHFVWMACQIHRRVCCIDRAIGTRTLDCRFRAELKDTIGVADSQPGPFKGCKHGLLVVIRLVDNYVPQEALCFACRGLDLALRQLDQGRILRCWDGCPSQKATAHLPQLDAFN
jgi:hypothetical protein